MKFSDDSHFEHSWTLKDVRRILVPQRRTAFRRELLSFLDWYNEYRPHMTLGGNTPDEVYFRQRPPIGVRTSNQEKAGRADRPVPNLARLWLENLAKLRDQHQQ